MIDIKEFINEVIPKLEGYTFKYSTFSEGDFGSLERVEFEGNGKVGAIDFWSSGWLGLDVYDMRLNDQILNQLMEPNEEQYAAIDELVHKLKVS
ncbi:hypothetical protein HP437_00435 (plasmid) [Serratia marcescens]|uniref:hypothetical protein n=1 Tax=Serratia marcescens TaxID=615 RepID=UPI0015D7AE8D|nr:hypothetical protein [Serratia marcescens]QLJ63739.1 hypothetical protein HP437_00435 [Serratia marcescens]